MIMIRIGIRQAIVIINIKRAFSITELRILTKVVRIIKCTLNNFKGIVFVSGRGSADFNISSGVKHDT